MRSGGIHVSACGLGSWDRRGESGLSGAGGVPRVMPRSWSFRAVLVGAAGRTCGGQVRWAGARCH
eukprot:10016058-Alexandrium_andersonii.AAC.1